MFIPAERINKLITKFVLQFETNRQEFIGEADTYLITELNLVTQEK